MDISEILLTVFAALAVCPTEINSTPEQPSAVVSIVVIIIIILIIAVLALGAYTIFCLLTCCLRPEVMVDFQFAKLCPKRKT